MNIMHTILSMDVLSVKMAGAGAAVLIRSEHTMKQRGRFFEELYEKSCKNKNKQKKKESKIKVCEGQDRMFM